MPFHRVKFANAGVQGYALAYNKSKAPPTVDVPCGPLSPVLADIFAAHDQHWDHKPTLDFFPLDVEGAEALVLSTIDFHALRIHVLMIEIHSHFCKDDSLVQVPTTGPSKDGRGRVSPLRGCDPSFGRVCTSRQSVSNLDCVCWL